MTGHLQNVVAFAAFVKGFGPSTNAYHGNFVNIYSGQMIFVVHFNTFEDAQKKISMYLPTYLGQRKNIHPAAKSKKFLGHFYFNGICKS